MEVEKENIDLKLTSMHNIKCGELFEHDNVLYMKSNETNELGIVCIRMDNGIICYCKDTARVYKVELTRIDNGKLMYKLKYNN